MAGSVNKVILVGNLGNDPEIRQTQDGRSLATFSIATSERWKDRNSGEQQERTEWHRVVVFSEGLVKVVEAYLKKGAKVYIEGQLRTRKYADKDGVEKYTTEVTLQGFNATLTMLDSRQSSQSFDQSSGGFGKSTKPSTASDGPASNYDLDDDIPF